MYENRARLLCSAEGSPSELFEHILTIADASTLSTSTRHDVSEICVDNELGFAKDRTISRLEDLFLLCLIYTVNRLLCIFVHGLKSRFSCRLTEMNSREYLEQHALLHQNCN